MEFNIIDTETGVVVDHATSIAGANRLVFALVMKQRRPFHWVCVEPFVLA